MAEVVLEVTRQEIVSVITRGSAEHLGLAVGDDVFAIVTSTELMSGRNVGAFIPCSARRTTPCRGVGRFLHGVGRETHRPPRDQPDRNERSGMAKRHLAYLQRMIATRDPPQARAGNPRC
jgi:hypothetical protein